MKNLTMLENALILGIKDYFKKNNFKTATLGLSGGLDSAVALALTVKALDKENITVILMPEKGVTKIDNYNDSKLLAKKFDVKQITIPINKAINFFNLNYKEYLLNNKNLEKELDKNKIMSLANSKARIRMTILYHYANLTNSLVIGTSDKSEIALGYTTKYGDNASDILVIGDLWKTQVQMLAKHLNIPKNILNKKPSAELIPGINAEKELGAPYIMLDRILHYFIEADLNKKEILKLGFKENIVDNVLTRIRIHENKRRSAILLRLSERSFHNQEWRMPITNKSS
tara:strand:+ start:599 stop:1459 length:861 start_codon:yes stop_codon:yes gene_type:complete